MNTNPEASAGNRDRVRAYHPERRTAVVLCGTGAHGAYHAGVLRALHEAGVKIDLLAGQGVGTAGAALAAIDGGARLWEANGIWSSPQAAAMYGWTRAARAALALATAFVVLLLAILLAAATGWNLTALWGVGAAAGLLVGIAIWLFSAAARGSPRRRSRGAWWWRILGVPVDATAAQRIFADALWQLIRGAAPVEAPSRAALGRRYSEVLLDSLGQPGCRELVLVATDIDARRDVVAALLREPFRAEFMAPRPDRDRRSEVLDLTGIGREHGLDVVAAGLTPPLICEPELVTFARDSFWRGETHRLCDRPGSVNRLLEEVAAAGVTQTIVVTAVATAEEPHRLRMTRLDLRSRLGDFQAAAEAAALRDALEVARLRFDAIHVISPAHNAVGPLDLAGAYDEASDRRQDLQELMERGYEDAYRHFIEPVVGASGDHLARADPGVSFPHAGPTVLDDEPSGVRPLE